VGHDAAGHLSVREEDLRIVSSADGTYLLRLTRAERAILRALPSQLRDVLDATDPAAATDPGAARLFPPAYADDPDREAEFRRLVHDELVAGRRRAADLMESTVDADRLNREELEAWVGALNDLRLVLGTRLEVTEDPEDLPEEDPRAQAMALYHYLGWLEAQAVDALASSAAGDAPSG
jgi:hypothetical protein